MRLVSEEGGLRKSVLSVRSYLRVVGPNDLTIHFLHKCPELVTVCIVQRAESCPSKMCIMIKESSVTMSDRPRQASKQQNSLPPAKDANDIRQHQRTHARGDRDADRHENGLDLGIRESQCGEGNGGIDGTGRSQRGQDFPRCLLCCVANKG